MRVHIRQFMGVMVLGFLMASWAIAGPAPVKQTELGVPVYPEWVEKRKDHQSDPNTGVHFYKYEYFSDDAVERVVSFYEKKMGREAAENKLTGIYTIVGADGVMVNIMGAPEGIPQVDEASGKIIKNWRSLITIMKTETASP
jgi:hypothetical protein